MENDEIGKFAEEAVKRIIGKENILEEKSTKHPYDIKTKSGEIIEVKGFKRSPVDTGFFYLTAAEKLLLDGSEPYSLFIVYNIQEKPSNPNVLRLSREQVKKFKENIEVKYWYPLTKKVFSGLIAQK